MRGPAKSTLMQQFERSSECSAGKRRPSCLPATASGRRWRSRREAAASQPRHTRRSTRRLEGARRSSTCEASVRASGSGGWVARLAEGGPAHWQQSAQHPRHTTQQHCISSTHPLQDVIRHISPVRYCCLLILLQPLVMLLLRLPLLLCLLGRS